MTQVDLWTLENELRTPDTEPLCGVDEAGRGPLAGPVCAAAVMLPPGLEIPGLNDSKKLSEKKREALYDTIIAQALSAALVLIELCRRGVGLPILVVLGLLLVAMGTYRSPAVALMPDVTPKPLRSRANAIINLMGAVGGILYLGLAAVLYLSLIHI